jgi:hypothetical protein
MAHSSTPIALSESRTSSPPIRVTRETHTAPDAIAKRFSLRRAARITLAQPNFRVVWGGSLINQMVARLRITVDNRHYH